MLPPPPPQAFAIHLLYKNLVCILHLGHKLIHLDLNNRRDKFRVASERFHCCMRDIRNFIRWGVGTTERQGAGCRLWAWGRKNTPVLQGLAILCPRSTDPRTWRKEQEGHFLNEEETLYRWSLKTQRSRVLTSSAVENSYITFDHSWWVPGHPWIQKSVNAQVPHIKWHRTMYTVGPPRLLILSSHRKFLSQYQATESSKEST